MPSAHDRVDQARRVLHEPPPVPDRHVHDEVAADDVAHVEVGTPLIEVEVLRIGGYDELRPRTARVVRHIVGRLGERVVDRERDSLCETLLELQLQRVVRAGRDARLADIGFPHATESRVER